MKKQLINIEEVIKNTRKYWYIDGTVEILGGAFIILIATLNLVILKISNPLTRGLILGIGQPIFFLLGSFAIRKFVASIKQKLTYPRTGYLSFQKPKDYSKKSKKVIRILFIILVGAVVGAAGSLIPENMLPLITAIFISTYTFYLGYYFGVNRFYLTALIIVILRSFLTILPVNKSLQFPFLIGGLGFIWLIFGMVTFWQYMHSTKPIEQD